VISRELFERIEEAGWQSYSSYRAHPIECAAIEAHIRVSARDGLWRRALDLDELLAREMRRLADAHPGIARIDGRGLHWTIEFHGPSWRDWEGHDPDPLASRIAARVLDAGAMIATSGEQTSLFIAPPLIIQEDELMRVLEALDHGLESPTRSRAGRGLRRVRSARRARQPEVQTSSTMVRSGAAKAERAAASSASASRRCRFAAIASSSRCSAGESSSMFAGRSPTSATVQ
jgi:Aminotransferase class-III